MAKIVDSGYRGNVNLKRSDVPIEWTPEKIEEWVKCANDPIYFAQKYIKIVHVDKGLIPIDLYDYQEEIIEKTQNNRRTVVVTSRQAGKTTTAVVVILHYVLFNSYKTVALLANKGDSAREILERIQIAYEALPDWLQQGIVEWNKSTVELENGSKIMAASTSSSSIRGKSVSFLYIDETAFVEHWDDFAASVLPTLSSGESTKLLYTSTPNGLNHFYKICYGAKRKRNGFAYVEVPWHRVPGRDEKWKKETLDTLDGDTQKFSQEYECQFEGSSNTLISGWKLKELVFEEPIIEREKKTILQYRRPQEDRVYIIVADVSLGKGLNYSAFHVIDVTEMPYRQVFVYRSNMILPTDYAEILYRIGKLYNNASILVESNDIGGQVCDTLHDMEYDHLLYTETAGRAGKRISAGFNKATEKGIRTTITVKSVGCSLLKLLIEQNQLIICDHNTIHELSRFSKKGKSYEAESGATDDLVMGLVLFAWLSDQNYFKELTDINTLNQLREKTEKELEEDLTPFGFFDDGLDEVREDDVVDMELEDGVWLATNW